MHLFKYLHGLFCTKEPTKCAAKDRKRRSYRVDEKIHATRFVEMAPEEKEAQRRSFAYGNVKIDNDDITREMIDKTADEMAKEK